MSWAFAVLVLAQAEPLNFERSEGGFDYFSGEEVFSDDADGPEADPCITLVGKGASLVGETGEDAKGRPLISCRINGQGVEKANEEFTKALALRRTEGNETEAEWEAMYARATKRVLCPPGTTVGFDGDITCLREFPLAATKVVPGCPKGATLVQQPEPMGEMCLRCASGLTLVKQKTGASCRVRSSSPLAVEQRKRRTERCVTELGSFAKSWAQSCKTGARPAKACTGAELLAECHRGFDTEQAGACGAKECTRAINEATGSLEKKK